MPSILSRTPPCPGSRSLVSLTLAFLFKYEIERSPSCEVSEINNVIKKRLLILGIIIRSGIIGINNKEKIKDPIDPDIVFFGLILVNFFPLKNFPKTKPPISDDIETNNENKIKNSSSGLKE